MSDWLRGHLTTTLSQLQLVDGEKLVELFESLELGLIARTTYEVDPSFFAQFEQDIKGPSYLLDRRRLVTPIVRAFYRISSCSCSVRRGGRYSYS